MQVAKTESVTKYLSHPIMIAFIVVRVLSALYILIDPFWGFMAYLFFDFVDGVMIAKPGLTTYQYLQFDRPLDWLGYVTMLIVVFDTKFFPYFLILLFVRLVGQILYSRTRSTKYYIIFPNYYEALYFWFILLTKTGVNLSDIGMGGVVFLILIFAVQGLRELLIHKYQHEYLEKKGQFKFALKLGFPERRLEVKN